MAQLAIKGHATRGNEVIEILEMLGGNNENYYEGRDTSWYYIIMDNEIDYCNECDPKSNFISFTLEKFLEKFPYKVGDKVQDKGATSCGSIFEIEKMRWEEDTVKYTLHLFGCNYKTCTLPSEYLQPYKEETMEEELIPKIGFNKYCKDKYLLDLGDYEIKEENGKTYAVRKQPEYPKTYEKCCKVLFPNAIELGKVSANGYNCEKLKKLGELLICRDAYWKIAGEEMGLGKPWEPDWKNDEQFKYIIICRRGYVIKDTYTAKDVILAFPTEDMRDAFKENFDKDIEFCKEFL